VLHAEYKCGCGICTSAKQKFRGIIFAGSDENDILHGLQSRDPIIWYVYLYHVRRRRLSHYAIRAAAAATGFLFYWHGGNKWWFFNLRYREERGDSGKGVHWLWREDDFLKRRLRENRYNWWRSKMGDWNLENISELSRHFYTFQVLSHNNRQSLRACTKFIGSVGEGPV